MKDFAAIDFETANGQRSSICSVGLVVVRDGEITIRHYRLVRPYQIGRASCRERV